LNTHKLVMMVKSKNPLVHAMLAGTANPVINNNKEKKTMRIMKKFIKRLNKEFFEYRKINPDARMFTSLREIDETHIEFWCGERYAYDSFNEYKGLIPKIQRSIGRMVGVSIDVKVEKL